MQVYPLEIGWGFYVTVLPLLSAFGVAVSGARLNETEAKVAAERFARMQAKDLSEDLLKKWLVDFKFKTWTTHRTTNPGTPVTLDEKQARAEQIAKDLCDNKKWHSHGRYLGIGTLKNVVRLDIEDYSTDLSLRNLIREYHDTLIENMNRIDFFYALHSTNWSSI